MSLLDNLEEKSPEERIKAIKAFEDEVRVRVGETLKSAERISKKVKGFYTELMEKIDFMGDAKENFAELERKLSPSDYKIWMEIKYALEEQYGKATKAESIEKPQSSKKNFNGLSYTKTLRV